MTTINKPDFEAQFKDEPIEWEGKWRNVYLRRTSGALLGRLTHPNRFDAIAAKEAFLQETKKIFRDSDCSSIKTPSGAVFLRSDFPLTVIQIPVKE